MGNAVLSLIIGALAVSLVNAEDPYLYYTWTVAYGTRSILGVPQQASHKTLQQSLESGKSLPFPDGVLINGQTKNTFSGEQGKTYMFRISNVGLSTSLNFRIQGHSMKLVELPKDYYIVASTRFTKTVLTATAVLHYANSQTPVSGPLPAAPAYQYHWSMQQARTYSFGSGQWTPKKRRTYNLVDALTRHTTQLLGTALSRPVCLLTNLLPVIKV
ncbi:hypothetical protein V6N13_124904 [Hibiscus sabdariffa]